MAKSVLGKGVGALLDSSRSPLNKPVISHAGVSEIALDKITANPNQPRKTFDDEALQELAKSIEENGIISPITVREVGVESYQIISGERRFRASELAGLTQIPAYIRKANDEQTLVMGLVENLQRENLDPIEIAQTYQRLIEEMDLTQEQVGSKVGKNHATIANSLRLLKLPPEIQNGLMNNSISEGHAKALLSLDSESKQRDVYTTILVKGLSVRATEDLVRRLKEKKTASKPSKSEEQKAIQTKLGEKLHSKVSVQITSKGTGKISIPFKDEKELKALVALIEKIK